MVTFSQFFYLYITCSISAFATECDKTIQAQNPTPSPINIPPSAGQNWLQLMVGVALITVLIVLIGVWVNRIEKK